LPENTKPPVLFVIDTGAVAVLLEKPRPPVLLVMVTGALNWSPEQPVPPMRTAPVLPEMQSGAVTVDPQIVANGVKRARTDVWSFADPYAGAQDIGPLSGAQPGR